MTLSVIIPCYRAGDLEPVLAPLRQLDPLEIIIVDSSPDPEQTSYTGEKIRYIPLKRRHFAGEARNVGAEAARGHWLLFVDADVILSVEALAFVKSKVLNGPTNHIFWGLYGIAKDSRFWSKVQTHILRYRFGEIFKQQAARAYGQSSHMLVYRAAFVTNGGFHPHLRMREDTEFAARHVFLGGSQSVHSEFSARHLREFSFISLLQDYFVRSYHAVSAQNLFPKPLLKTSSLLDFPLLVSWLGSLSLCLMAIHMHSGLLMAIAFLLPTFGLRVAFRQSSWMQWAAFAWASPFIGIALLSGALAGQMQIFIRSGQRILNGMLDWIRLAGRVMMKSGRPVHTTHFLTSLCNLRCDHCFYKETLDQPTPKEIPLARLQPLYQSIGPLLWWAAAGGEPFLRRDLDQVVAAVQSLSRPKLITIPTNGFFTNRVWQSVLRMLQNHPQLPLTIQLSIDGDAKTHDRIRGKNSWRHAVETMQRLRKLEDLYPNLKRAVITVVTEQNAHLYPQLISEIAKTFSVDQIHINLYRTSKLNSGSVPKFVTEKYREALRANMHRRQKQNMFKIIARVQKNLILRVAEKNEFMVPCEAGTLSYTIWEDETVSACEIRPERMALSQAGGSFWKSSVFKTLRREIKQSKCQCTYECAMSINAAFGKGAPRRLVRGWSHPANEKWIS